MKETLFVYGTLMPNCPNAHILENIVGKFLPHPALGGRTHWAASDGGNFCVAGVWAVAGLCGRVDCVTSQCRFAGSHPAAAGGVSCQPAVPRPALILQ